MNRYRTRREGFCLVLLCLLAGLRVGFFAAAMPFWGNNDEVPHFDTLFRYAHGSVPRRLVRVDLQAAPTILAFRSPEILRSAADLGLKRFPPPIWTVPGISQSREFGGQSLALSATANVESTQPPLHYALQAGWYHLGHALGLRAGWHLYWLRFAHVPLVMALVWVGYAFCERRGPTLRWGVPLLLAFWPQDVWYQISNDALSPLVGAFALLALWRLRRETTLLRAGLAGASVAAALLTKLPNLMFLPLLLWVTWQIAPRHRASAALLVPSALAPFGAWLLWNEINAGDWTNSADKIRVLNWTPKPVMQWLHHPLWMARGAWFFWSDTLHKLWRGEGTWHGVAFASPQWDGFYVLSSTLFLGAATVHWCRKRIQGAPRASGESPQSSEGSPCEQRSLDAACWATCAFGLLFLMLLSVSFDFGACFYPSRQVPFLTSGRLILGALLPLAILYVRGLEILTPKWRARHRLLLLGLGLLGVTAGEVRLSRPAIASQFNWFHSRVPADATIARF